MELAIPLFGVPDGGRKKGAGLATRPGKLNDQRSGSRSTELLACLVVLVNR
jgi:hypothetical protein